MLLIRKNISLLAWFILPAYFLILANSTLNKHSHSLTNGNVISHSHPFKTNKNSKSQGSNHNHSKTEFIIFDKLAIEYFENNIQIECLEYIPFLIQELASQTITFAYFSYYSEKSSRAPPYQII